MSLLVIGTLAYDTIETTTEKRADVLGGSAMFFSVAAAAFRPVQLVAVVGKDFRRATSRCCRSAASTRSGVEHAEGRTFRWSGRYESDWNTRHTIETQLNVFEKFDPKIPPAMRSSKFLFLANASPVVQAKALDQVEHPTFTVARHDEPVDRDHAPRADGAAAPRRRRGAERRGGADAHGRAQPDQGREPRARGWGRAT